MKGVGIVDSLSYFDYYFQPGPELKHFTKKLRTIKWSKNNIFVNFEQSVAQLLNDYCITFHY